MHEFDTYISSIIDSLRINKKKKGELSEEFVDHLQMLKRDCIKDGMTEEDAVKEVIKRFGESKELKLKLSKSMFDYKTIPNILFGIFFTVLIFRIGSHMPIPVFSFVDEIPSIVLTNVFIGSITMFIPVGYFLPIFFRKVSKVQNVSLITLLLTTIMGIILSVNFGFIQTGFLISNILGGLLGSALGFTILYMINKVVCKYKYRLS